MIGSRRHADRALAEQTPVERRPLFGILDQRRDLLLQRAVDLDQLVQRRAHVVEPARLEIDHRVQQQDVGRERRLGERPVELLEERVGGLEFARLEHRPRRLEQRVGQPFGVLRDAEVEVIRVVVFLLLVRDAPEREVGEVLDAVVAAVDEERESILIDLLDDLAQRPPRRREVPAARVNQAPEVQRGRVEARLAVDGGEQRFGARGVAGLVGDLGCQVGVLLLAVLGQCSAARGEVLAEVFEHRQDRRLLARLQRDVDHGAVGGRERRRLRSAPEDAQQVALRRLVAARADQRPRQRQLGDRVFGRVVELGVARRFDHPEQRHARDLGVAGDQLVFGRGDLGLQALQRRRFLVPGQDARLLQIREVLAHGIGRRRRGGRGIHLLHQQRDEESQHHFRVPDGVLSVQSIIFPIRSRSRSRARIRAGRRRRRRRCRWWCVSRRAR